jgi:hypothetical protein
VLRAPSFPSLIINPKLNQVDNPSLSKVNINLNTFKFNHDVNARNFSCEPQIHWIQVPTKTICDLGPTCHIPTHSEASKCLEFNFDQIWLK